MTQLPLGVINLWDGYSRRRVISRTLNGHTWNGHTCMLRDGLAMATRHAVHKQDSIRRVLWVRRYND